MQLERIAIRLRTRAPWEALDLGNAVLRAWAAPAYRAWAASYWAVGLTLLLVLWPWQDYALVILWWLKPLFDRVLLFTYSRCLFGTATGPGDVVRALPGLLRGPGVLAGLTWRRFSMARSFLLPVWQLEEQHGADARARFKLLARRHRGYAVWLTFVCANLVTVLGVSLVVLAEVLAPVGSEGLFSWQEWLSGDMPAWKHFVVNVLFMVAESLVEPLYVASGFALYLNRRSELEGWDIELAFRRLAARRTAGALAAAVLVALLLTGAPGSAEAAQPRPAAETSVAKRTIGEVLADPVFGREEEELQWRPIPRHDQDDAKIPAWLKPYLRAIEFLSQVLRGFVWVGALLLAAVLLYLVIRYREAWLGRRGGGAAPPEFLFGLDVRPGSLPADVAAAARAAAAAGRLAEALSLLYRGALVAMLHRRQVEFRAGDTEADCLARARGHLDGAALAHFGELLEAWRSTAYGRRPPPAAAVAALCDAWPRHFGAPGEPA